MSPPRTPPPGADSWLGVTERLGDAARQRREAPSPRVALARAALALAGRLHGARVLELGCGGGTLARLAAEQGALVVGTDVAPAAIHAAEQEVKEAGTEPRPVFSVADPAELSQLPRGPFDAVIALLALHESTHPERVLRNAAKLLHPRGRLVLGLAHPWGAARDAATHPSLASLPALLAALRGAGLRLVAADEPRVGAASADTQAPQHLLLLAERTGKRGRNRGTSG